MSALRLGLASLVALGMAFGCNGLLGIDNGGPGAPPDGGPEGSTPDAPPGDDGGATPDDGGTDGPIVVGDAGPATTLATDQNGAISLVQDVSNVYWIAGNDVMTVPKAGGASPRKVATVSAATVIAVDPGAGGNVYVAAGNLVNLYPKAGGGLGTNVMTLAAGRTAVAMGVDDTNLFAIDYNESNDAALVRRAPKNGGGTGVSVSPGNSNVLLMGVDTVSASWINEIDENDRTFYDLKGAGPPTSHATDPGYVIYPDIRNLTMDATKIYWLDSTGSTSTLRSHLRASSSPTSAPLAVFPSSEEPFLVVVQDGVPYVLVTKTVGTTVIGDIVMVKGGTRPSVVKNLEEPTSIAVDANGLYVAENKPFTKGTISKFPLPK